MADQRDNAKWPLLVLTLEGDEARRARLVVTLERLNIGYHLFWGVDGSTGLSPCEEQLIDREAASQNMVES